MPTYNSVLRPSPRSATVIRGVVRDGKTDKVLNSQRFSNFEQAREWARKEAKRSKKLKRRRTILIEQIVSETYLI